MPSHLESHLLRYYYLCVCDVDEADERPVKMYPHIVHTMVKKNKRKNEKKKTEQNAFNQDEVNCNRKRWLKPVLLLLLLLLL